MADYADVCVLIPTLDEAETIASVVEGFRDQGLENVLVVDGHSTDGTREIAREHGARVIEQSGSGKGQAVREGVAAVEVPYVLMVDGDGTYRPEDAPAMLEPLLSGAAVHVIGNRFADMAPNAMTRLNRAGNRLVNRAFATVHGRNLVDILSGYRAFTTRSFQRFVLSAEGFGVETELAVECVKHGVPTEVVPVSYRARPGESETNLHPIRDGAVIFLTLYKLAKTNNPLFYFGSVGGLSALAGVLLGVYVAYDWVANNVSHDVLAVVGTLGILLGVQLLMFGVLSDMIVTLNREQTRRLEAMTQRVTEAEGRASAGPSRDSREERDDAETEAETEAEARPED